ncbi:MAG: peptidylprolyl isomerase [Oscillospiraceae bacterium]|nr:peptidylprolyl isomerase [Oscillospiraceae bacterium]
MKKLIAMLLAMVMCLTVFTGCADEEAENGENKDAAVIDADAAYAKYDPDTVVMTINGEEVTWSEFFHMLNSGVSQLQYYFGDVIWENEVVAGYGYTFEEYSMLLTMDSLKQFHTIASKAADMNITLSDEDLKSIEATENTYKQQVCGEDATDADFEQYLMENYYMTMDVYQFINESSALYEKLYLECVGENGEKITDEEILDYANSVPYVTAKHILVSTVDDEGNALSEEEIAAAKQTIEDIYAQLSKITDQKKLLKTFDSLMNEYSQDTGLAVFPDGYTFTTGEMVEEFETTAFALEEYQVSEPVETSYGYHILLRLPTQRNSKVDYDYENGVYYTVETYATSEVFRSLVTSWMEEADVQWAPEFEGLTAEQVFA